MEADEGALCIPNDVKIPHHGLPALDLQPIIPVGRLNLIM